MTSKLFGSTLIIAGTTIGAGMLALPITSSAIGFPVAAMLMFGLWAVMAFTALLMLELHQHAPASATLHTLAQQFLGRKGQIITTLSMLFLFYALCSAYVAGGGSQFHLRLETWMDISKESATVLFTLLIAAIVALGTRSVDRVNRLLFVAKILMLLSVLYFLTPSVRIENLTAMPLEKGLVIAALPVIFTSFGFHGSIPAIVNYMGKEIKALRVAILVGSLLPLLVYLAWQISSMGVITANQLGISPSLQHFISTLSQSAGGGRLLEAINLFADLALLTSFLGVSLGLFEFIADSLNKSGTVKGRILVAAVTFTPPLGFALFYPQGFITALGYAAIALAVLAIFLPTTMVKRARQQSTSDLYYQVAGGRLSLHLVNAVGCLVVAAQIALSLGLTNSLN
ncbi:aromatic amino acid transport family protein [Vibrio sp. SCSIO 43136]|uniref:aromatic amino acid transport family protein n=1 Tax=Vibrio sp. SCSIO 43136 TaxID=2819101 RepID=UPI002075AE20|nr:aromatic amino acid transport family protein [Vibrio sp. SCSIO 43136]USD66969.1 amino acid permease [Vibrio sp. SCSIO 43136]